MFNDSKSPVCPLLNKPCIKDRCAFYLQITGTDKETGAPTTEKDCLFIWNTNFQIDAIRTMEREHQVLGQMRNEQQQRFEQFMGLLNPLIAMGAARQNHLEKH